jgi:hypothetical protein
MGDMKMTPIIAIVDDETLERLTAEVALEPATAEPLPETAKKNGWTYEMLMAGVILKVALEPNS